MKVAINSIHYLFIADKERKKKQKVCRAVFFVSLLFFTSLRLVLSSVSQPRTPLYVILDIFPFLFLFYHYTTITLCCVLLSLNDYNNNKPKLYSHHYNQVCAARRLFSNLLNKFISICCFKTLSLFLFLFLFNTCLLSCFCFRRVCAGVCVCVRVSIEYIRLQTLTTELTLFLSQNKK